jgi:tetratricopeptide (TPR) repeat protein
MKGKRIMHKKYSLSKGRVVAAISLTLLMPLAALADSPGRHPGYLHAMQDLRNARNLLNRPDAPNAQADENRAVREIDACIHDLEKAAWMDHKIQDVPVIPDAGLDFKGKLHRALDLLKKAHNDMDKEEDDPAAVGFRDRANKHVDRAIGFTRRAIGDKFDDGFLRD